MADPLLPLDSQAPWGGGALDVGAGGTFVRDSIARPSCRVEGPTRWWACQLPQERVKA